MELILSASKPQSLVLLLLFIIAGQDFVVKYQVMKIDRRNGLVIEDAFVFFGP